MAYAKPVDKEALILSMDSWLKGKQEADTIAKAVVTYVAGCVPDCSKLSPGIIELAKKADIFYQTPFNGQS